MSSLFALTLEVGTGGCQHRDSGHGDPPGPKPACPSVGWGGSNRTLPSLVWDCTLGTTALEVAAERNSWKSGSHCTTNNINYAVHVV